MNTLLHPFFHDSSPWTEPGRPGQIAETKLTTHVIPLVHQREKQALPNGNKQLETNIFLYVIHPNTSVFCN